MGFHKCDAPASGYIHRRASPLFSPNSSGDNIVAFDSKRRWQFPDALCYYIWDCGYQPPAAFVDDIMNGEVTEAFRLQTKGLPNATTDDFNGQTGGVIGYLSQAEVDAAARNPWGPPEGFREKLVAIMVPLFARQGLTFQCG